MKAQALLKIGAVTALLLGLASAYYYGQTPRPYQFTEVRFCPLTANKRTIKHYQYSAQSQSALDNKYCRFKYRLLTEVWNSRQFNDVVSLPDGAFITNDLAPSENPSLWLLVAPAFVWMGYYCWAAKDEIDNESSFQRLEDFKTSIKRQGLITRTERDLQSHESERIKDKHKKDIDRRADNLLVQERYISLEELQQQYQRQSELEDLQFSNTKKQFAVADSVADKSIAENKRDKRKADAENINPSNEKVKAPQGTTAQELVQLLQNHEGGWLWDVIESTKPVWVLGGQGSGKSSFAASIVMSRKAIFDWNITSIVDAHGHKNRAKAWKLLIPLEPELIGERNDYLAIGEAMNEAVQRWSDRTENDRPIQTLWDELTQLSLQDDCKESVKRFVRHSLTDVRKAAEYLVCISHAFTNAASGNAEGFNDLRQSETIQIKRKSKNGRVPLNHAEISGLYDDDGNLIESKRVTVPDWFYPDSLLRFISAR